MQKNAPFKNDVAVVGVQYLFIINYYCYYFFSNFCNLTTKRYPGTNSPTNAQQIGTPLWYAISFDFIYLFNIVY
jgi:hypothetical protein